MRASDEVTRKNRTTFTLTPLMVVVAACATFSWLVGTNDPDSTMRRSFESKIEGWKPTEADRQRPDERILSPAVDIVGVWERRGHLDGSSLSITGGPSDKHQVSFSTGGCLGHFQAERTGSYDKGALVLSQPITEYCPATYKVLFAVRIDGNDYLVPSVHVDDLQRGLSSDFTEVVDYLAMKLHAYHRAEPAQ